MDLVSSSSADENQFSDAVVGVVDEDPNDQTYETSCLKEFCFADLETATNNFGPEALLGGGGNGRIYKGWMDKKTLAPSGSGIGMAVAIKLWNPENIQAFEQWQSEVNVLGRCYHPNLIELLGYCWEDKMLVLVYEFMENGSLQNHLFGSNGMKLLSWDIRLKIASGAARGLVFLHTLEKQIIYRDFKPSAILLDANYNPKLSDFCLAKLGPSGDKTHVTTRMLGTQGYVAPEYLETGHLYTKSDVYSFGVMLLELLTGLRLVDLDNCFKPTFLLKCKLKFIMKDQFLSVAASEAAQLTLNCLANNYKDRPSMKQVLEALLVVEALTSMKDVLEVREHIEAVTSMNEAPKVLEHIEAVNSMEDVPNVLEHIDAVNSMDVPNVLEHIETVNSMKDVPNVLEHIEALTEIPTNSNRGLLTSLKATCQCVSSKLNCMRKRNNKTGPSSRQSPSSIDVVI